MGGIGSGNWYRWQGTKQTTETVRRIDIRYLIRLGRLAGVLTWSRGGEVVGSAEYKINENYLVLLDRTGGSSWQETEQSINFDRTPCNYGGERLWFLCPLCARRVAILYATTVGFFCRHCCRLPYTSQHETYPERMQRKVRKIHERLGGSDNILEKPKGMHQRTFERLLQKEDAANLAWESKFETLLQSSERGLPH